MEIGWIYVDLFTSRTLIYDKTLPFKSILSVKISPEAKIVCVYVPLQSLYVFSSVD